MERTITLPDEFTFTSGDHVYTVQTADIPDTSLVRLAMYGRRMFNDSVNGAIHAEKDRPTDNQRGRKATAGDWIDAMKAGTLGTGHGGASRLSDLEKELRDAIHKILVKSCGYKSGDATKIVSKGSTFAFRTVCDELKVSDAKRESAWDKMVASAQSVIDQRKAGPDISEMFADDES